MMDYQAVARSIILAQQNIIGPVALEQAKTVEGLSVGSGDDISLSGDPKKTIDTLVERYRSLFGQVSVEICREAALHAMQGASKDELPASLK